MVPKSGMITEPKMRSVNNGRQGWHVIFRQNTQGNGFMEKFVFFQSLLQMLAQDFSQSEIFGVLSGDCGNEVTFVASQFIGSNVFGCISFPRLKVILRMLKFNKNFSSDLLINKKEQT